MIWVHDMIAIIVCLSVLAASLVANGSYAWSQGQGDVLLSYVYLAIAIGFEGIKVLVPIRIGNLTVAWRIIAVLAMLISVLGSMAFGLGFAGMTRGEASAARAANIDAHAARKAAYDAELAALAALPRADASVAQLEAQLDSHQRKSGPCRDKDAPNRGECRELSRLRIELAKAAARDAQSVRVDAARLALDAVPRVMSEDTQASQIARALRSVGIDAADRTISAWVSVLIVLAAELLPAVAFRLAYARGEPQRASPSAAAVIAPSDAERRVRAIKSGDGIVVTAACVRGSQRALAAALGVTLSALRAILADLETLGAARVMRDAAGTSIYWTTTHNV